MINDTDIEIIRRKLSFTHSGNGPYYDVFDEYLLRNKSNKVLTHLWIEVEGMKPNLEVLNSDGEILPFLSNDQIRNEKEFSGVDFSKTFIIYIEFADRNKISIGETRSIKLVSRNYGMETTVTPSIKDVLLSKKTIAFQEYLNIEFTNNLYVYLEIPKGDVISFARVIGNVGEKAISISKRDCFLEHSDNSISFYISNSVKSRHSIDGVRFIYVIEPEKSDITFNFLLEAFIFTLTFLGLPFLVYNLYSGTTTIGQLMSVIGADFISVLTLALIPNRSKLITFKKFLSASSFWLFVLIVAIVIKIQSPELSGVYQLISNVKIPIVYITIPSQFLLLGLLLVSLPSLFITRIGYKMLSRGTKALPILFIVFILLFLYIYFKMQFITISYAFPVYDLYVALFLATLLLGTVLRTSARYR